MPTELAPLPVQISPLQGESGRAFLLRAAQSNGLTLRAMLRWLGVRSLHAIAPGDIPAIAYATQATATWLSFHSPLQRRTNGRQLTEWHGHRWTMRVALRGPRPQICAECLREGTSCLAVWEMTGCFACGRHRRLLLDRCPHCNRALSWNRPAIEVCSCGRYLTAGALTPFVEDAALGWVHALAERLAATDSPATSLPLEPTWLRHLSPDGLFCIAHAAGVQERPDKSVPPSVSKVCSSPSDVATVLMRGLDRLRDARSIDGVCPQSLRNVMFEPGLDRLAVRGRTEADRDIARELLDWVRDPPRCRPGFSGRRPMGQLALFAGGKA